MRYRHFGRTALSVSELGFGCGPTAGLMIDGDVDIRRHAVARAIECGINYFDTGAAYGQGRSEKNLGEALADLSAKVIVATKVTLELHDLDDIPAAVEKSINGSLDRLNFARLDIVHVHNRIGSARAARSAYGSGALISVDDALGARGVAETFRRLKADGRVGAIGCCAFGGEHEAVAQVIDSSAFDSVMVNYSVLNPTAWQSNAECTTSYDYAGVGARAARCGMAVVALRVLEGGLLASFTPSTTVRSATMSSKVLGSTWRRCGPKAVRSQPPWDSPSALRYQMPRYPTFSLGSPTIGKLTMRLHMPPRDHYRRMRCLE